MNNAEELSVVAGGIVTLCSLFVGSQLYGIDTLQIREVLGAVVPQRVPLAPDYIAGVVPYRGEILTTVSFRVLLGLQRCAGAGYVLVLDDEENKERFGLMVDRVGGVVTLDRNALVPNPNTLDARGTALFDGACRMPSGLIIHLDPRRLQPSRLAGSGLFAVRQNGRTGEAG